MNWFQKMKGTLYGYLSVLSFRLQLYRAWSTLYRLVRERKYKDIAPPLVRDMDEVVDFLSECRWDEDGASRWFDSVSYVGRMVREKKGDCDDFAQFSALAIDRSQRYGYWRDDTYETSMLAVIFQDEEGKLGGHVVTLLKTDGRGGAPMYGWMDYDLPVFGDYEGRFFEIHKNIEDVGAHVTRWFNGPEGRLLAIGHFNHDLKCIEWKRG